MQADLLIEKEYRRLKIDDPVTDDCNWKLIEETTVRELRSARQLPLPDRKVKRMAIQCTATVM
jgi:hypothetical protein